MKIYIVGYQCFDDIDIVGYFLEEFKAEECCKYLNRIGRTSCWDVYEFNLDETDYYSLNKELDEQERLEAEKELEKKRQRELAELARLKAKYET